MKVLYVGMHEDVHSKKELVILGKKIAEKKDRNKFEIRIKIDLDKRKTVSKDM